MCIAFVTPLEVKNVGPLSCKRRQNDNYLYSTCRSNIQLLTVRLKNKESFAAGLRM